MNLSYFLMVGFAVVSLLLIALSVTYLRLRAIKNKESKLLTDVTERLQRQKEATEVARAEAERYRAEAQKQSARAETARKTVETQVTKLQELDKAKSRFFANVSHDCRTPLMLTIGPLEDLRDGLHGPIPSQISREIRVAIRNAHRLLHLINEMLDVVKIEAGQIGLRPRRVDLVRFIDDIVDSFSILAERKRMHLRVETPPGSLEVSFDRNVLEKIVVNLVANALEFTPDGGTVHVTAELIDEVESDGESGKGLRITVRDSGPGIPAEEIPNIFERFYRAGKSRRLHPGSGIGLSLTKDLAELHGGRIDAQSEEGFGSKFVVTIPVQAGDGQASEEMAGVGVPPPPGEGTVAAFEVEVDAEQDSAEHPESPLDEEDVTTVLVVEDDKEMRSYLRKHLAQQYRVLEAADGEQGLDMVKRWLPDLIVSDVVMPRLDGHALSQAVIQDPEVSYIPVILLTAGRGQRSQDRGPGIGCAGLSGQTDRNEGAAGENQELAGLTSATAGENAPGGNVGRQGVTREPGRGRLGR